MGRTKMPTQKHNRELIKKNKVGLEEKYNPDLMQLISNQNLR